MKYRQTLILALGSAACLTSTAIAQSPDASQRPAPVMYQVTDLGPVGLTPPSQPDFIANSGIVAGAAQAADGTVHAVVWFGGSRIDLAANRLGGPNSQAFGANSRGQVVGEAQTSDANGEDFCGFNAMGLAPAAKACRPFLWQNGAISELPNPLGGANAVANQINSRGDVTGLAETSQPRENGCAVGRFAPVLWHNGALQALPTYSGDLDGTSFGINDRGQAVGATGSCAPFNANSQLSLLESHAVLWDTDGSAHLIPGLGGDGGFAGNHACGINSQTQVVGHSDMAGDATFYGFFWSRSTGTVPLYPFPGDFASLAISINDSGQIVGASLDGNFNLRAMIWQNGAGIDLNTLLPAGSPLYLQLAGSINAAGEIVGIGQTANGDVHGFLAAPRGGEGSARTVPLLPASETARRLLFHYAGIRRR